MTETPHWRIHGSSQRSVRWLKVNRQSSRKAGSLGHESAPKQALPPALFLQSEVDDPFAHYKTRREAAPVQLHPQDGVSAVYSHAGCLALLNAPAVEIPPIQELPGADLNAPARAIAASLVRLANPPRHDHARQITRRIFAGMTMPDGRALLGDLLPPYGDRKTVDWVSSVCRRLPILTILTGLRFDDENCDFLLDRIETLTRFMLPARTPAVANALNGVAEEVYDLVDRQLSRTPADLEALPAEDRMIGIGNTIGLMIQSYDAGRGLLSNALLQTLRFRDRNAGGLAGARIRDLVVETLRFDPPIHNTRRLTREPITADGTEIPAGHTVLLVLAAANRDPGVFSNSDVFDPGRANNADHLTFGAGGHRCIAEHLAVDMTDFAIEHLLTCFPTVKLASQEVSFEPLVNARLPREIPIVLET